MITDYPVLYIKIKGLEREDLQEKKLKSQNFTPASLNQSQKDRPLDISESESSD